MKKLTAIACLVFLASCDEAALGIDLGAGASGGGGGFQEYLVVGNRMSFESCRARGGFIIRDQGSPMVMCDPTVIGDPVPATEFDHPDSVATAQQEAAQQL